MSAVGPMTQRYASHEPAREIIHSFVEFARMKGTHFVATGGLFPEELTVKQISELIDEQHGIDRTQLHAERCAQLQPGAECACGE
jgi:hypothetical protein